VPPVPPALVPPAAAQPPGTADTRFDLPPVTEDLMAAGYDLMPQQRPDQPGDSTAAVPASGRDQTDAQGLTARPGAAPSGVAPLFDAVRPVAAKSASSRRRNRRAVAAAVFVVVVLGVLVIRLATGGTAHATASASASASASSAAKARASAAAQARAAASASAAAQASAAASASAAAQASASASAAQAAARAVIRLPVAAAEAFGPDGFADGDNPGIAKYAISGGASQPWATQWYATPQFGMLKHGTGLLLDLGRRVTVSSIVMDLSRYGGASLQIRAGSGTAPQDLRVAATASNAVGVVRLTLPHPVAARYLLVWFTQLPPDGAGHYQETVSQVQVTGRR